jgi:hypothetical protein
MHIKCKTLWLQKDGNAAEDYEDSAYPREFLESNVSEFKCAIADGATESSFAGLWADILVEGLVYGSDLDLLRKDFVVKVGTKSLPWYAEEKLQSGAFAAVALLSLKEHEEGNLCDLSALGDSCIMHVRDGALLTSFPLDRAESFNNSPSLLCSNGVGGAKEDKLEERQVIWLSGDVFWLMTDALACWALKRLRDYDDAFEILEKIEDLEGFKKFVHEHRAIIDEDGRPTLKNDDVTFIKVSTS